jgi:hypothetical protein
VTGGNPRSTGVYYDTQWDDNLSAPGSNCSTRGTVVSYKENINFSTNVGDSVADINPAKLPRDPNNGCAPVYPHSYVKVNNMYEVARAAGLITAAADKHPSYDLLNGPSGTGLTDFYGPEFNAAKSDISKILINDELKVTAVLNWIKGKNHQGTAAQATPAIYGMNFQSPNIAQKFSGYLDAAGAVPNPIGVLGVNAGHAPGLVAALDYVDGAIGRMVAEITAQGQLGSTMIIVTAKHGNSPVNRASLVFADAARITTTVNTVQAGLTAAVTADTLALVWLKDHSKVEQAAAALRANLAFVGGDAVYTASEMDLLFGGALSGNPGRHPDLIITPAAGSVWAGVNSKLCDHGSFRPEDTHVALLVVNPRHAHASTVDTAVSMTQIAPTILHELKLKPHDLQAVQLECTPKLPLSDDDDHGDDGDEACVPSSGGQGGNPGGPDADDSDFDGDGHERGHSHGHDDDN